MIPTIAVFMMLLTNQSSKKPVATPTYEVIFDAQLQKVNTALVDYAETDCTAPEFGAKVYTFIDEANKFGTLVRNMPDGLDEVTHLRLAEEAHGALYFSTKFVDSQNTCIEENHGDKHLKLSPDDSVGAI